MIQLPEDGFAESQHASTAEVPKGIGVWSVVARRVGPTLRKSKIPLLLILLPGQPEVLTIVCVFVLGKRNQHEITCVCKGDSTPRSAHMSV